MVGWGENPAPEVNQLCEPEQVLWPPCYFFSVKWRVCPGSFQGLILVHACMQRCFSCGLTLWDPVDCSPPGSSVHGILQARTLEGVAMPSSRESSWPRDGTRVSCGSCIIGGFFTTEPSGKPELLHTCLQILFCSFLSWFQAADRGYLAGWWPGHQLLS